MSALLSEPYTTRFRVGAKPMDMGWFQAATTDRSVSKEVVRHRPKEPLAVDRNLFEIEQQSDSNSDRL
jgi:hypothetical protein